MGISDGLLKLQRVLGGKDKGGKTHGEKGEVNAIKGPESDAVSCETEDYDGGDELQDAESQHKARQCEDMISFCHLVGMYATVA